MCLCSYVTGKCACHMHMSEGLCIHMTEHSGVPDEGEPVCF